MNSRFEAAPLSQVYSIITLTFQMFVSCQLSASPPWKVLMALVRTSSHKLTPALPVDGWVRNCLQQWDDIQLTRSHCSFSPHPQALNGCSSAPNRSAGAGSITAAPAPTPAEQPALRSAALSKSCPSCWLCTGGSPPLRKDLPKVKEELGSRARIGREAPSYAFE